jgi:polysaccharide pyruvyl transferase CsaB
MIMPPPTNPAAHVVLSGYYGFNNLGDDLILQVLVQTLQAHGCTVTVLSQDPALSEAQWPGVQAISRTHLPGILKALRHADAFVSGGGGLFQDITGPASPLYYGGLIHLAALHRVPVIFWGQGVGPLSHPLARWLTATALKRCAAVTVRDEASARLVETLTQNTVLPEVTADPVWLLDLPPALPPDPACWTLGISLRTWPDLSAQALEALASLLVQLPAPEGRVKRFWLFAFQENEDRPPLQALEQHLHAQSNGALSCRWVAPAEILDTVGQCDGFIGMRFHSLVLALLAQVPLYGLSYDPKVDTLLHTLQQPGCPIGEVTALSPEVLSQALAQEPSPALSELQTKASRNVIRLLAVLGKT